MTPLADPAAFGLLVLVALVVALAVALVALLTVASRWVDAQKDLADKDDRIEALEDVLAALDAEWDAIRRATEGEA